MLFTTHKLSKIEAYKHTINRCDDLFTTGGDSDIESKRDELSGLLTSADSFIEGARNIHISVNTSST